VAEAERKLQKSPNWDEQALQTGFRRDGFPFHEGFPSLYVGKVYEIILRDGSVFDALVDPTRQYQSEGLEWRRFDGQNVGSQVVVAWREKPQDQ